MITTTRTDRYHGDQRLPNSANVIFMGLPLLQFQTSRVHGSENGHSEETRSTVLLTASDVDLDKPSQVPVVYRGFGIISFW